MKLTDTQAQATRGAWLPLIGFTIDEFGTRRKLDEAEAGWFNNDFEDAISNRDVVFQCIVWAEAHIKFETFRGLESLADSEIDNLYQSEIESHRELAIKETRCLAWEKPAYALYELAVAYRMIEEAE